MQYNISSYHNGLGDSLQFSTIPEILSKQGHEVNLYMGSDVLPFRNREILDLVWGLNPYINGVSTTDWNIGDVHGKPYQNIHNDFIKNWESVMGLEPQNSLPKIYYEAKKIIPEHLKTTNNWSRSFGLIELSSHTLKYDKKSVQIAVNRLLRDYDDIPFFVITSNHQNNVIGLCETNTESSDNFYIQPIKATSLFHCADLINSCSVLITLNSGLHSLAAAIQRTHRFEQVCLLPELDYQWVMESKKFVYQGIKYVKLDEL